MKDQQYVNFQAKKTNNLEVSPTADTLEKKGLSTVWKIALGIILAVGALALIDAFACEGKHLKQIFSSAKKEGTDLADDAARAAQRETNSRIIIDEVPAVPKEVEVQNAKATTLADDAVDPESVRRGVYGQDLDDPLEPLNRGDIMCLYYEDPFKTLPSSGDPLDPYSTGLGGGLY